MTNDLERRMGQHREGLVPGFTSRYRIFRLKSIELARRTNRRPRLEVTYGADDCKQPERTAAFAANGA
ncbi:MAG: hypothetical protein ACLP3K_00440 [Candidatus Acidiferrales bacterium]